MGVWLRSSSQFKRFAWLTDNGIVEVDRHDVPASKVDRPDGHFDRLSGVFVALYLENGRPVIRVGERTIPLDSATAIHLAGPSDRRRLIVFRFGEPLVTLDYAVPDDGIPRELDFTHFIEDEDFDFGLFMKNICDSPARQRVMLEVAAGG